MLDTKIQEEVDKLFEGFVATPDYFTDAIPAKVRMYLEERVRSSLHRISQATAEECLKLLQTHTEQNGSYCDTGEDMEWGCRSDCTRLAANRITNKFNIK